MVPKRRKRRRRVYGRRSRPLNSCASFWHRTSLYPWMRSNKSWAPWTILSLLWNPGCQSPGGLWRILINFHLWLCDCYFRATKIQSTAISTAHLRQFQRVGCDQDWQTGSENGWWMAQATGTTRPGWITVVESMRLVGLIALWDSESYERWMAHDLERYNGEVSVGFVYVKVRFTSPQMEAWYCWFTHNQNLLIR